MATVVRSERSGSVRGIEGGVEKLLSSYKQKSDRKNSSPLLHKIIEEEAPNEETGKEGKVVLYITSLQAVKDTYGLCKQVVSMLRALRVCFTTKDVFLHPDYGKELSERMGHTGNIALPQLFVDGEHIGDGQVIVEMNEIGELNKLVEKFKLEETCNEKVSGCSVCGGQTFIMCLWCQGSKKGIRNSFSDLKCTVCNQNGLQLCTNCSM